MNNPKATANPPKAPKKEKKAPPAPVAAEKAPQPTRKPIGVAHPPKTRQEPHVQQNGVIRFLGYKWDRDINTNTFTQRGGARLKIRAGTLGAFAAEAKTLATDGHLTRITVEDGVPVKAARLRKLRKESEPVALAPNPIAAERAKTAARLRHKFGPVMGGIGPSIAL